MFNDTGLDGIELCSTSSLQGIADASIALRLLRSSVLMDIAQEGGEVSHVVLASRSWTSQAAEPSGLGMFNLFFGGQRYEISVIIAQKHAKSADFGIKIAIISEK